MRESLPLEPVAVSLDVDDPAVVEQSIQNCRGDDLISEEFLPVDKALVRGNDGGALFLPGGDELEEEMRLLGRDRKIASFIHNNQTRVEVGLHPGLALFQTQGRRGGAVGAVLPANRCTYRG